MNGGKEESTYNGHFESFCYHSVFIFNHGGDCLVATLGPGNVYSADGWEQILLPP